jgi:nucleotidyltransferase substrate binding protein (TIGR01987 family)
MVLDLSSLQKAVDSLERAIKVAAGQAGSGKDQEEVLRAGVIQNFEFTYELCWKFMQRWLKENQSKGDVELPRTRKELFRMAAQYGIISDPLPWFEYGDARNLTAHTYDLDKAEIVFKQALRFSGDAKYLLIQLEKHND